MMVGKSFAHIQIKKLHKIARQNNGSCLSKKYINAKTKLKWRCQKSHVWKATPDHILRGQWCPKCGIKKVADSKRSNIVEMQQLAKRKDGKCLSKTYTNGRTKLQWQCHKGHKWKAVPESIKSGSWCPVCSGHASTSIDKFRHISLIAKTKNGKCLSKQYSGAHHALNWECEHGHQWAAVPSSIKQGSWCPICAKNSSGSTQRGSLEEMQEVAINRGGECLSKIYKNSQTKLEWKCHYGHKWKAVPNSVKHGTWCPSCNFNIGEEICRTFFETVFSCEFPKVRPRNFGKLWMVEKRNIAA